MTDAEQIAVDELRTKVEKPKNGHERVINLSPKSARTLLAMIDAAPT